MQPQFSVPSLLTPEDISAALDIFQSTYKDMDVPADEFAWFKRDLEGSFTPRKIIV
jgi:hypothetical protein